MYIGTDFQEKENVSKVLDMLDFTFAISSKSIPYLDKYGVSYINSYSPDTLRVTIFSAISRLQESDLSVKSVVVDHDARTLALTLDYSGKLVTTEVNDLTGA